MDIPVNYMQSFYCSLGGGIFLLHGVTRRRHGEMRKKLSGGTPDSTGIPILNSS